MGRHIAQWRNREGVTEITRCWGTYRLGHIIMEFCHNYPMVVGPMNAARCAHRPFPKYSHREPLNNFCLNQISPRSRAPLRLRGRVNNELKINSIARLCVCLRAGSEIARAPSDNNHAIAQTPLAARDLIPLTVKRLK